MKKPSPLVLSLLLLSAPVAQAAEPEGRKFYMGVGYGSAMVSQTTESPSALQLIIGHPLTSPARFDSPYNSFAIEGGYVDVSDYDLDSYWITPVYRHYLNSEVDLLLRFGMEAGHTTGRIGALGLEYKIERELAVRLEYVERSQVPVALINVVYRP